MTGAYLRVKRNGEWQAIEVEHLTDEERAKVFATKDAAEILNWLNLMCSKLSEVESILDGLVADGILEKRA